MAPAEQSAGGAHVLRRGGRLAASSHAYALLLGLILVAITFQLAAPEDDWPHLAAVVLQGATLLIALRISGIGTIVTRVAVAFVAISILATTGALAGSGEVGGDAGRVVSLMLAALAPIAIAIGVVRETRAAGGVTMRVMFGVLCIYLLLGLLFAFAYGVVGALDDASFFAEQAAESQSNYLYFSFVTQTTTGYGDLTAATGLGRSLAITEALAGQIYLVTVVALIVGNLGRSRTRAAR